MPRHKTEAASEYRWLQILFLKRYLFLHQGKYDITCSAISTFIVGRTMLWCAVFCLRIYFLIYHPCDNKEDSLMWYESDVMIIKPVLEGIARFITSHLCYRRFYYFFKDSYFIDKFSSALFTVWFRFRNNYNIIIYQFSSVHRWDRLCVSFPSIQSKKYL